MIKRMRVEPISTYLERYRKGGVAHPVTIANGFVYLSGLPPFDPETGEIKPLPLRAAVRAGAGAAQALPGGRRLVAVAGDQMQCLLRAGADALRDLQRRL